ncbi:MAG TPA: hypothetical protein VH598_00285, partial [Verrucomicrobiae bacterium]|nr:hypothetical protein [Verrucomicrobiae bacterium]
MNSKICRVALILLSFSADLIAAEQPARFDAAPFAILSSERNGLIWEDPREIHEVIVHFKGPAPQASQIRLEYWGSRWPQQHLPKNREPGGGDTGWMELGNWHQGGWRVADADAKIVGNTVTFTFRPVNEREFPAVKDYDARFRYTLKIRVAADVPLSLVEKIQAFTDSVFERRMARLAWKEQSGRNLKVDVFNGALVKKEDVSSRGTSLILQAAQNSDPNTFDRTLVTVDEGKQAFTFKVDDLSGGPLYLPEYGVAILPEGDLRDYAAVEAEIKNRKGTTLYDRVARMPEQTWKAAWAGMPPKKSRICFPLGLDGARQKFRLDANGEIFIRWNDQYMRDRPGRDTARLQLEKQPVHFRFGLPDQPVERHTEEESQIGNEPAVFPIG